MRWRRPKPYCTFFRTPQKRSVYYNKNKSLFSPQVLKIRVSLVRFRLWAPLNPTKSNRYALHSFNCVRRTVIAQFWLRWCGWNHCGQHSVCGCCWDSVFATQSMNTVFSTTWVQQVLVVRVLAAASQHPETPRPGMQADIRP